MTELDCEDLAPIVELQAVELKRLLRENERLSRRVDVLISELGQLRELQKRELGLRQGQQDLLLQMQEGTNRLLRLLEATRLPESAAPSGLDPVDGGETELLVGRTGAGASPAEPDGAAAERAVAERADADSADSPSSPGEEEREPPDGAASGGGHDESEAAGSARVQAPIPEFLLKPVDREEPPGRRWRRRKRPAEFAVDLKGYVLPTRIGSLS